MEPERVRFLKTEEQWRDILVTAGALHVPERPEGEALVLMGRREKSRFSPEAIEGNEALLARAALDLLVTAFDAGVHEIYTATRVVGPQRFAESVAELLRHLKNRQTTPEPLRGDCRSLSVDKPEEIRSGEVVLIVEDAFTTGRKSELVEKIASSQGATTIPCILALVNLSGREEGMRKKVVSLVAVQEEAYA